MSAWRSLLRHGTIRSALAAKRSLTNSCRLYASEEDYTRAREWYQLTLLRDQPLARIGHAAAAAAATSDDDNDDCARVNSKAQLRIPLSQLCPLVPALLHRGLRQSRYYVASSDSLLIQADDSRKQAANKDACYRRLTELVTEVYRSSVPGETSPDQRERVKGLKTQYNEARLRAKKIQSSKKAARSKGFGD